MKATAFAEYFDFGISRITKDDYKWKTSESDCFNMVDERKSKFYEVYDLQGCFHPRYISDVSDLTECFDSMEYDYIDRFAEEDGFVYNENNTEKSYYEQMLDWMQTNDYKNTFPCEVVACLVNPWMLEDDVKGEQV